MRIGLLDSAEKDLLNGIFSSHFIGIQEEYFIDFLKSQINTRPHMHIPLIVDVPISYPYSSKRLLYTAIDGTRKNTIGGTQWENF
jgi:hypothetical protein